VCHESGITPENAVEVVQQYDVIVDCTDTPSTRYLISDAAVVASKPLVSGSALGTEGQITLYGYRGGPCYRCIFPSPPPPESVLTCGEGGILGPGPFNLYTSYFSCGRYWGDASAGGHQNSCCRTHFFRYVRLSPKHDNVRGVSFSSVAYLPIAREKGRLRCMRNESHNYSGVYSSRSVQHFVRENITERNTRTSLSQGLTELDLN
jgi:hypothetical protein